MPGTKGFVITNDGFTDLLTKFVEYPGRLVTPKVEITASRSSHKEMRFTPGNAKGTHAVSEAMQIAPSRLRARISILVFYYFKIRTVSIIRIFFVYLFEFGLLV